MRYVFDIEPLQAIALQGMGKPHEDMVSSVRDSDRMLGILASKSRRAERGEEPIKEYLLLTRYSPDRVKLGTCQRCLTVAPIK